MRYAILAAIVSLLGMLARAESHFIEGEVFVPSSDGWAVVDNRAASALKALRGSSGDGAGTAAATVTLAGAGRYRIWVRHNTHANQRAPFTLAVLAGGQEAATHDFDFEAPSQAGRYNFVWDSFEADLPAGEVELRLAKYENRNSSGYLRHVDCVFLSTDLKEEPEYLDYGAQTFVRVTVGDIYEESVYVHIFADHYRSPWYGHHYLSKGGTGTGLAPAKGKLLAAGESTPWCNITRMLYQDSGAILNFTIRHTYHTRPERLRARFEFATAPDEAAIVRTWDVDSQPNGLTVVCPPDLTTEEHRARLKRDLEFAEETGKIADAYDWPTIGKAPERFPIFVSASIGGYGTPPDQAVIDRERQTLGYFGFTEGLTRLPGGTWRMLDNSYCRPDIARIEATAAERAAELKEAGKTAADVVYSMVMDEPTGQGLGVMAEDAAYQDAFRAWLKQLGLSPADLLVERWEAVRTVTAEERETLPALYYYSQRFRTQALGEFLGVQRRALEAACGGSFPVLVNFSDGATYYANFYGQGVDYFELLNDDTQNAIWGEDWANGSSSYQCGAYNVDLMRAAARERGQTIGHYLIAHAGRKALDVKLKAAGEVGRGVKILKSFSYGVYWGSHEGGPAWRSSVWQNKPQNWRAYAEINREIGGAEDLLIPAMPPPAQVAILYSSSSDIWEIGRNNAFGFARMHTWMALAHAQVPVDFLSEEQVANGGLRDYRVCYLFGPNLTRAAAQQMAGWVKEGGALVATAGAATRDEYDRPLATIAELLPATRGELATAQAFLSSGRYLHSLNPIDQVTVGDATIEVLSVKQTLAPMAGATVLGTYGDGSPAWVQGAAGKGSVTCTGFLPALDYIRQALVARMALTEQVAAEEPVAIDGPDAAEALKTAAIAEADRQRLAASANPWAYPAAIREAILAPVRAAKVEPPIQCSVPLVDAVYMTADAGIVIPLANYTLAPLAQVELSIRTPRPIVRAESIHQGALKMQTEGDRVKLTLPLDSTDYIKLYYQ